jgi:hypothetical protein
MADEAKIQDDIIWGAIEVGRAIGRDRQSTYHLLEHGHLPATKCGRQWVASRTRLRQALTRESRQ